MSTFRHGGNREVPEERRRRQRAQGLVEFAAAVPVLFFVLFGVLEGSLAMFTINSARFAAGEAARQLAESGTDSSADSSALLQIRTGPLGATALATVTEIDI